MQHRIFYIDALRVIAVVMMILMHLPQHYPLEDSFYAPLGDIYSMALFFTISGYVTNLNHFKLNSRLRLLVPFFVIGMLYTCLSGKPFSSFFTTMDKNGYWFLWIMALYSVFIYTIIISKMNYHFGFCLFMVIMIAICVISPNQYSYLFSMKLALLYWPFIYLGLVLNNEKIEGYILNRKMIQFMIYLLGGISLIFALFKVHTNNLAINKLYAFCTIVSLFFLYKKIFKDRTASNHLEAVISVIGQNSLQIYTLHYFFLYLLELKTIQSFAPIINKYNLELFLSPIVAFGIIGLCVITARFLYSIKLGCVFGR